MSVRIQYNTPEEEAAIQRGIDLDPDNPELGDEFFARARPAREMMPPEMYAALTAPRRRGAAVKEPKAQVTLRLDRDVLDALRATGPGWQSRANAALRKAVLSGGPGE